MSLWIRLCNHTYIHTYIHTYKSLGGSYVYRGVNARSLFRFQLQLHLESVLVSCWLFGSARGSSLYGNVCSARRH